MAKNKKILFAEIISTVEKGINVVLHPGTVGGAILIWIVLIFITTLFFAMSGENAKPAIKSLPVIIKMFLSLIYTILSIFVFVLPVYYLYRHSKRVKAKPEESKAGEIMTLSKYLFVLAVGISWAGGMLALIGLILSIILIGIPILLIGLAALVLGGLIGLAAFFVFLLGLAGWVIENPFR